MQFRRRRAINRRERESKRRRAGKYWRLLQVLRVLCFVRVWHGVEDGGTERDEREPILISEHVFAVLFGVCVLASQAASSGNFPNER